MTKVKSLNIIRKCSFVIITTLILFAASLNSYAAFILTASPSNAHPDTWINLSWDSYPGTLIYTLYRDDGINSAVLIKTINVNVDRDYLNYTDNGTDGAGLIPETGYSYTIHAFSDQEMLNEIATASASVLTLQMLKPTITSSKFDINSRSVTLNWTNNSSATASSSVKTSSGISMDVVSDTGTTSTFTDPGIINNIPSQYVVTSSDSATHSSADSDPITVVPVAPPVIFSSITNGITTISWGVNPYIENFELERSKYSQAGWGTWQAVNNSIAQGTQDITDTPDSAGTYRYRLAAKSGSSYSGYSNISQAVTKPAAPSNLSCSFSSQNCINLSWTNNPDNYADLIIEKKAGTGNYNAVTTLDNTATSFSDSFTIVPGTDYYYRVSAFDSENNKAPGNEYKISATVPVSPSSLCLTLTSDTRVDLKWTDNSNNEIGFKIERKTDSGVFSEIAAVDANTPTYADENVTTSHTYTYRVRAYNHFGNSANYTNEVSSMTSAVKSPNILNLSVVSPSFVQLTWSYPESSYFKTVIERKTGSDGSWSAISEQSSGVTTYNDFSLTQNTHYFYRIKAKSGNYIYSAYYPDDATGKEAYTVFSPLSLIIVSSTQIDLNWTDNATGETGFKIERKTDSGSFSEISTVDANKVTFSDKGVTAGHTYVYRVLLVNSPESFTIYTNEVSASTNNTTAPNSLELTAVSPSQINLTWDYPTDGSYTTVIERKIWDSGTWVELARVDGTKRSYIDTGLSENTQYFYRIRAFLNTNIFSQTYPNDNTGIGAFTRISKPTNLKGESPSDTQILLTWTSNTNGSKYVIERKTEFSDFTEIGTTEINATNWSDVSLIPNSLYTYRIKATTANNSSDYSDEVSVACSNINAPSNLKAGAQTNTSVDLSWVDNSTNESGFEIWRTTGTSSQWELISTVESNSTKFSDTGLSPNKQYSYKIRAYITRNSIYSGYSNSTTAVTTIPNAPSDFKYTRSSSTSVKLVWVDNSTNESGFKVERKDVSNETWAEIASLSQNITSYSITSLDTTAQYYFRVKAYNIVYNSYSYSKELEVSLGIPSTPSDLSAVALSASQIQLNWADNSSNELGFSVERKQNSGSFKEVGKVSSNITRFVDNNLNSSQQYSYRVKAYNNNGSSSFTDIKSAVTKAPVTYTDISTVSWAKSAIETLSARGIIKGKSAGIFAPNDKITRAEFVCIIVRAFNLDKPVAGSFFDVSAVDWFYKEVMAARSLGIISGDTSNHFYPNKPVTREDAAVIISRTLKYINKPLMGSSIDILKNFTDKNSISAYAAPSMASLYAESILKGKSTNSIAPKDNTTRAEAALLISKIIDR